MVSSLTHTVDDLLSIMRPKTVNVRSIKPNLCIERETLSLFPERLVATLDHRKRKKKKTDVLRKTFETLWLSFTSYQI